MLWRRKKPPVTVDLEPLVRGLHAQKLAIEQLAEDLAALRGQHESLRGRFYATGAHKPAREPQSDDKAAVLREFFKPGQPAKHT